LQEVWIYVIKQIGDCQDEYPIEMTFDSCIYCHDGEKQEQGKMEFFKEISLIIVLFYGGPGPGKHVVIRILLS